MKKHQNYTICEWFVQMICELSRYFSFAAEEWQSFPHELVTSTQVHGYDHPAVRLGMVYGNMIPIILFYYLDDNANSFSNIFPSKITKTSVPSFPKQFHCFDAFFFPEDLSLAIRLQLLMEAGVGKVQMPSEWRAWLLRGLSRYAGMQASDAGYPPWK